MTLIREPLLKNVLFPIGLFGKCPLPRWKQQISKRGFPREVIQPVCAARESNARLLTTVGLGKDFQKKTMDFRAQMAVTRERKDISDESKNKRPEDENLVTSIKSFFGQNALVRADFG